MSRVDDGSTPGRRSTLGSAMRALFDFSDEESQPADPLADLPDFTSLNKPAAAPQAAAAPVAPRRLRAHRAPPVLLGQTAGGPAHWAVSEQANPFLIVLGSSGAGKSELLRVVGWELHKHLPVVFVDVHGDLRLPGLRRLALGPQLGINPLGAGADSGDALRMALRAVAPQLGHVQDELLGEALEHLAQQPRPSFGDLRSMLEHRSSAGPKKSAAAGLLAALKSAFASPVFSAPPLDLAELLRRGGTVDLVGLDRSVQAVAAGALLAQIFAELRRLGPLAQAGRLRCWVGLDEAAFLKESPFIGLIARESRKFGLGLAVATQQARDLSATLTANAASAAVFALQNSAEATQSARLLPGIDAGVIQHLAPRGECIFRDSSGLRRIQITPLKAREKNG